MARNIGYLTAKIDKASDEVYTPSEAITPIIPFLRKYHTIWCPFDKRECSKYVTELEKAGFKVIATHIDNGQNFFDYEPKHYDIIVSNPPFSIKDAIIKRLYELDKPYCILLPVPALQGQDRFPYMKDCGAIIFNKRINFYKDKKMQNVQKGVSFASFYLTRKFMGNRIKFLEI